MDWYREGEVRDLVLKYYAALRFVLGTRPDLRRCLKHCRHCRIYFLTYPSNDKRRDLLCPFGCSEAHRKREASGRSAAYYRSEEGRIKKRVLNRKRYLVYPAEDAEEEEKEEQMAKQQDEKPILEHIRMVTSLIEGREVSIEEIKEMLKKKQRQHSLPKREEPGYGVEQSNKDPP